MNAIKNFTVYRHIEFTVKGNKYAVTIAVGASNYVSTLRLTNNPYGTSGKQFKNIDEAILSYKSPEIQAELLLIKMITNN